MNSTKERIGQYIQKQLCSNSVREHFPASIFDDLPRDITSSPRRDLRNRLCFTIDCDNTQDRDDAVSIERTDSGYRLGVYIADVAGYVAPGSSIDQEAVSRGCSIYLPDRTIPMLPELLSNDLCSLEPEEDRNVIAILIDLDCNAAVTGYEVTRAVIRSRVRGCYSEVNLILNGTASEALFAKYEAVIPSLREMNTLALQLRGQRAAGGASTATHNDPRILFTPEGIELYCPQRGDAENIIEEFMVLANRQMSEYFEKNDIPAIYRIQLEKKTLASYASLTARHAEMGLDRYMHFTSPIRRLADLKAHQMLAAFLDGTTAAALHEQYDEMMLEAAELAVKRSRRAKNIQTACARFCYGQYFLSKGPAVYQGHVTRFDQRNHPIIHIDRFGIDIPGTTVAWAGLGQAVRMMVSVDRADRLIAYHVTPMAA